MPGKLKMLPLRLPTLDSRTVKPPPKKAANIYGTRAYRIWRDMIIGRAGGQCEFTDGYGVRCSRAEPDHRMFADHIHELRDKGDPFSLSNGRCLCSLQFASRLEDERGTS